MPTAPFAGAVCVYGRPAGRGRRPRIHVQRGFSFGLALHVGDVLYGSIGSNRLDFTRIGPAVNLAERLEKVAGQMGRTLLASQDFAGRCRSDLVPIGKCVAAGFAEQQLIFALRDKSLSDR